MSVQLLTSDEGHPHGHIGLTDICCINKEMTLNLRFRMFCCSCCSNPYLLDIRGCPHLWHATFHLEQGRQPLGHDTAFEISHFLRL